MTAAPTFTKVEPTQVADEWRTLAARSRNVFGTFEWAEMWWRHFGAGRECLTVLCRNPDGTPLALLPLYVERRGPLRLARFIGDGVAGELGPLCAPEDTVRVGHAMLRFLETFDGWDLLIGRSMPGARGWSQILGGSVVNREASPVVDLRERGWEDLVSGKSKRFRERVLGAERRLGRRYGFRYRLITDPAELPTALDALFDLHRRMRAGRPSSFLSAEPFHRDFARCAAERGWLRLWILELQQRPTAAVLDYRFGELMTGYQVGMDPGWRRKLHVRLLVTNSIRAACEEGVDAYHLGRGGADYKYEFANADPGVESVVMGQGAMGRPLASAMYHARGLRPTVRQVQRALNFPPFRPR